MKSYIVAVDGPAGSGKSTIAKLIAKKYNFTYLDTGAMYRMIAYYTIEHNIFLDDKVAINKMLDEVKLDIVGNQFFVDGKDVTELIRTPEVNAIVSEVAAIKEIRKKLVDLQRAIGNNKKIILDGRDTGTTVFPNADVKIFLLASPEIRAKRRLNEYNEKNTKITYEEVLESIKKRDYIDSTREESPLVMASDAKKVDSSDKNIEEVVAEISKYIDESYAI